MVAFPKMLQDPRRRPQLVFVALPQAETMRSPLGLAEERRGAAGGTGAVSWERGWVPRGGWGRLRPGGKHEVNGQFPPRSQIHVGLGKKKIKINRIYRSC